MNHYMSLVRQPKACYRYFKGPNYKRLREALDEDDKSTIYETAEFLVQRQSAPVAWAMMTWMLITLPLGFGIAYGLGELILWLRDQGLTGLSS